MHTNTHGSIEASDMMIDEGAYKGRETIKEETDLSFMEERDKRALQD